MRVKLNFRFCSHDGPTADDWICRKGEEAHLRLCLFEIAPQDNLLHSIDYGGEQTRSDSFQRSGECQSVGFRD